MGTHRFRLSDMIPNSWVHKMKYMSRTRNPNANHPRKKKPPPTSSKSLPPSTTSSSSTATSIPPQESKTEQPHLLTCERKSYYFRRELTPPSPPSLNPNFQQKNSTESPRKSPKQRRHRRSTAKKKNRVVTSSSSTSSVSACFSCRATVESVWTNPDWTSEDYPTSPLDSSSNLNSIDPEFGSDHDHGLVSCSSCRYCGVHKDIVIDKNEENSLTSQLDGFDTILEIQLPPIVTKRPNKFTNGIQSTNQQQKQRTSPVRSPGMRLRVNSPIIATGRTQACRRKSVSSSFRSMPGLSESYAVVKSSADPQRDFMESMLEMILENNLRTSKDLKDLLACYLLLNSDEYHELIVEVFKQIWFDIAAISVK